MSHSTKKKLDAQTETRVVAMMARGDSQEAIQGVLAKEMISISPSTLTAIRKRNKEALSYMQRVMMEHEATESTKILSKARKLIDGKLDRALNIDRRLEEISESYRNEEIDEKEYHYLMESALRSADLSISELNAVAKESFNQSQIEQGKPTSISNNPDEARQNLKQLLGAIDDSDEVKALQIIFNEPEKKAIHVDSESDS